MDHSRSLVCAKLFQISKNAMQVRIGIDRRGSRNTLRLFRISYVKYSTGANITIRTIYRALRKPDSTVAQRAFLDCRCNDNTQNGTTCFSARQRYFASPSTLFSTIFSLAREKMVPPEAQLQRRCKNGTSGASGKEVRACGAPGGQGRPPLQVCANRQKRPAHSVRG